MDLHLHTPASTDYQQSGVTVLDILRRAEDRGLDIIALTDHNSVRGYADLWREIKDLELLEYLNRLNPNEAARLAELRRLLTTLLVLPGFEFTATFGFHILAIFPETTSIRMMEHILLSLGVPEDRFGSGEVGATTDVLHAYEELNQHGAIVIGAHANSSHGVAMQGLRFGGQTKIAYTQDEHLHALEVTDLASTSRRSSSYFFSGVKPEYPRRMHLIQGSDAHRLERDPNRESVLGVGDRATEVRLPERSFDALKALFQSTDWSATRPARAGGPQAIALHTAREAGPAETVAFHERPAAGRAGPAPLLRDLAAMANTRGGVIYAGAGPIDRRTIPGVTAANVEELRREIESNIAPVPPVTYEMVEYEGKSIAALTVAAGTEPPYVLSPGQILVRRGAESVAASRAEIVAMVQGTSAAAAPPPIPTPTPPEQPTILPAPAIQIPAISATGRPSFAPPEPQQPVRSTSRRSHTPARLATNGGTPASVPAIEEGALDEVAPRTGVEIVEFTGEGEQRVYTMRDLRNGRITRHVPHDTQNRLWRYAIQQRELKSLDTGHIRWKGDFGFWKVCRLYRNERRFNLAFRGANPMRVFYGVSEEGLTESWKAVIPQPRPESPDEE